MARDPTQEQQKQRQISKAQRKRERIRQAVRKCRQKKKDDEFTLIARAAQLEIENAKLRSTIEMMNSENRSDKENHANKLSASMREIVKVLDDLIINASETTKQSASTLKTISLLEKRLKSIVDEYVERHESHGKDKQMSLRFILKKLLIDSKSSIFPMTYLTLICPDHFNQSSNVDVSAINDLWNDFVHILQLSDDQQNQIKKRRLEGERVIAEIKYCEKYINDMHHQLKNVKFLADEMSALSKIVDARQFAKFIIWVQDQTACRDMLDHLYHSMMSNLDKEIDLESRLTRESDMSTQNLDKLLFEVRSSKKDIISKLFREGDEFEMKKIILGHFHPNVIIIDPSNGGELHGHEALKEYVAMLQKSFTKGDESGEPRNFSLIEKNLQMNNVQITGVYQFIKQSKKSASKIISCDAVISARFAENSGKFDELLVSMDALGQITRLGLSAYVKEVPTVTNVCIETADKMSSSIEKENIVKKQNSKRNLEGVEDESKLQSPISYPIQLSSNTLDVPRLIAIKSTIDETNKNIILQSQSKIKDMFETDDQYKLKSIAEKILHPECVFSDSNMAKKCVGIEECIYYINRIKRAFSKLNVVNSCVFNESNSTGWYNQIDKDSHGSNYNAQDSNENISSLMKWTIYSLYIGSLLSEPKPCKLHVDIFIEFDYIPPCEEWSLNQTSSNSICCFNPKEELKIKSLQFSWDASNIMSQLQSP